MKPVEIKDLVTGLLAIIFAAIALGQYRKLEGFARREVADALRPKSTAAFFPTRIINARKGKLSFLRPSRCTCD